MAFGLPGAFRDGLPPVDADGRTVRLAARAALSCASTTADCVAAAMVSALGTGFGGIAMP